MLWHYGLADEQRQQHHDVAPLPNGNVLVIAWDRIAEADAVARGRDADQVGAAGLWPDVVLEIEPTPPAGGKVVWQWRAWDHLIQDRDADLPGYGAVPDHPERIDVNADHRDTPPLTAEQQRQRAELERRLRGLGYVGGAEPDQPDGAGDDDSGRRRNRRADWLHTNSIAYLQEHDLIVLSTPNFNELWVIDHSTTTAEAAGSSGGRWGHGGDLLWRWGNPRMYGAGDEADQRLFFQHDPSWIVAGDELRLLVFNTGRDRPGGAHSSVDELVLPFDPAVGFRRRPGEPFGPPEPVWSYADPDGFYSMIVSGAQRLENGNTLICSGVAGRLFEVTPAGRIVWDYRNPHGGDVQPPEHAGKAPPLALFRGARLGRDHPGVRRLLR